MAEDKERTSSLHDAEDFELNTSVQMHGLLLKKPFTASSGKKWQRRFFIIKEGFILYYSDSEARRYDKSRMFNTHPKGAIPLGGCKVMPCTDGPQKFAIRITHDDFKGSLMVATQSEEEREEWMKVFMDSGKVTWKNALLGEKVIVGLEEKSAELSKEKQDYIDKLKTEAAALEEEKGKKSELEELAATLEKEKIAIEDAAKDLRLAKDSTEQELQAALDTMKKIEEDKTGLEKLSATLRESLATVSEEKSQKELELEKTREEARVLVEAKEKVEADLLDLKKQADSLNEEKDLLQSSTSELQNDIEALAEQQKQLEEEKQKSLLLLQERESEMQSLAAEKDKVSSQVELEKRKRRNAEKRLRLAEDSLKRLDKALRESGVKIDLEIETDVKNLREFFEECIEEERYAAEKLTIMREAIHAQPKYKKSAGMFAEGNDIPASPEPVEDATPLNGQGKDVPASPEPVEDATPLNGQGKDAPASPELVEDATPLNGQGKDAPASPEPVEDATPLNGQGNDVPASPEPVEDAAPLNGH